MTFLVVVIVTVIVIYFYLFFLPVYFNSKQQTCLIILPPISPTTTTCEIGWIERESEICQLAFMPKSSKSPGFQGSFLTTTPIWLSKLFFVNSHAIQDVQHALLPCCTILSIWKSGKWIQPLINKFLGKDNQRHMTIQTDCKNCMTNNIAKYCFAAIRERQ